MSHVFATAETMYPEVSDHHGATPAERVVHAYARLKLPTKVDPHMTVPAIVNHGRWIVECPFCTGAQFASRTDPRFLCITCRNALVAGAWVRVVWPSPEDQERIEQLLGARADARHMNWRAEESTEDLARENAAHGVEGR